MNSIIIIILISTLFLIRGLNGFFNLNLPNIIVKNEYILYDNPTQGLDANTVCLNEYGTTAATIYTQEENDRAVK